MENSIIELNNVTKVFKIHHDKSFTLKERVLRLCGRKYETFKVLDNVTLHINKAETVGLIGRNGSGKSSILKLITKIIYPNQGVINVNGRVSSLIELGAGFHPDFSGRENIYTNASIFGLSKKEIDSRLETIIAFSELNEFIDSPVRTYSSGMYMRLAFSVAINVKADILLIDEILAVGDVNFQKKCLNKLAEIQREGTTIVIVSHDLETIKSLCNRAIWISHGKVINDGNPNEVVNKYLDYMANNP